MKHILTALAFVLLCGVSFAQKAPSNYVSLNGGVSLPMGDFGATSGSDFGDAGYAESGFKIDLDGAMYFYNNFGVGINIGYGQYQYDQEQFGIDNLKSNDNNLILTEEYTYQEDNWSGLNVLVGPQYGMKFDQLQLDFKLLIGLMSVSAPEVKLEAKDSEEEVVQEASSGSGFAINLGAAGTYYFGKHFGATLNFDLISTNAGMEQQYNRYFKGNQNERIDPEYDQPFSTFNIMAGVAYRF